MVSIAEHKPQEGRSDELHWHSAKDLGDMAFDHNRILDACLESLRDQIMTKPVVKNLLPEKFTFSELQRLYEAILAKPLDKRNFRKKILRRNMLVDLDEWQKDVAHRPAKLYSFQSDLARTIPQL